MGLPSETSCYKTQSNAFEWHRGKRKSFVRKHERARTNDTCFLDKFSSFQVFFLKDKKKPPFKVAYYC
jgi:hypothetical protein